MGFNLDRRSALAGAAAAMLAPSIPAFAQPAGNAAAALYRRWMVIDACGSLVPFDPNDKPGIPLLPRFIEEIRASGLTAQHHCRRSGQRARHV